MDFFSVQGYALQTKICLIEEDISKRSTKNMVLSKQPEVQSDSQEHYLNLLPSVNC